MLIIDSCAFCELNQLNTLKLYHNRLPSLQPGILDGLDNLVNLDIGRNLFETLDNNLFENLTDLRISVSGW